MNIGKSFSFIFDEEGWFNKLLVAAVVAIIPIVNFAWVGYLVDLMRNVFDGDPKPLPSWDDFGGKFMKRLILTLAAMIYSLPLIILSCVFIPIAILPAFSSDQDVQTVLAGVTTTGGIVVACCLTLYILLLTFVYPAIYVNYAKNLTFGSCFKFGEFFPIISRNLGDYLIGWVIAIVLGFLIGLIAGALNLMLSFIPCLGWIISLLVSGMTSAWASAVFAHVFGQVGMKHFASTGALVET